MSKVDIEVPDGRRILKSIALFEQKELNLWMIFGTTKQTPNDF